MRVGNLVDEEDDGYDGDHEADNAQYYTKEAALCAKVYNDQKYTGVNDSFDYKLTIFKDICRRSQVRDSCTNDHGKAN